MNKRLVERYMKLGWNKFVSSGEIHEAWVEFINDSVQFIPQVMIYSTNIRNGLHPDTSSVATFRGLSYLCKNYA